MPFVKLDCGILNSTLWFEREAREVFLTALLMAEPCELTTAAPQIEINTLNTTGWSVPPGWYGFVHAASVGILHRAGVEQERGFAALELLGSPENNSRSPEFDGRRLVRVNGGFVVLNYMKYRERDYTTAARSKRYREKKAAAKPRKPRASHRDTVTSRRDITQAEAEAYAEVKQDQTQSQNQDQNKPTALEIARRAMRSTPDEVPNTNPKPKSAVKADPSWHKIG